MSRVHVYVLGVAKPLYYLKQVTDFWLVSYLVLKLMRASDILT